MLAAVLLACFRRLVSEELEDKPACRLPVNVDVEEGPRSVSSRHSGVVSSSLCGGRQRPQLARELAREAAAGTSAASRAGHVNEWIRLI